METTLVKIAGRSIITGIALWLAVTVSVLSIYLIFRYGLYTIHPWLTLPLDAIVVFQSIAFKDLVDHIRSVQDGLNHNLEAGRKRVSQIVGRDTEQMDHAAVCRATIESGSENYNDGAIAPLFWLVMAGPAGALFYRTCNTLDAMVGHRDERYEKLGKCSARVDDILNFIPARVCAFILCQPMRWYIYRSLKPDAIKHPSWNAGWPEAAMAKRLGIVIGGEMYLHGQLVQTQEMNEGARQPDAQDISQCIFTLHQTYKWSLITTFSVLLLQLILW